MQQIFSPLQQQKKMYWLDLQGGVQLNTVARMPKRLLIPTSETGSNNANYSVVAAKNNQRTKVWWDVN